MIRDMQPVELYYNDGSKPKLVFWIYPVEKDLYAYELAINESNGVNISENVMGLIHAENIVKSFDVHDIHSEYRVFLRVHPTTT